jgi:hypothetical protein
MKGAGITLPHPGSSETPRGTVLGDRRSAMPPSTTTTCDASTSPPDLLVPPLEHPRKALTLTSGAIHQHSLATLRLRFSNFSHTLADNATVGIITDVQSAVVMALRFRPRVGALYDGGVADDPFRQAVRSRTTRNSAVAEMVTDQLPADPDTQDALNGVTASRIRWPPIWFPVSRSDWRSLVLDRRRSKTGSTIPLSASASKRGQERIRGAQRAA